MPLPPLDGVHGRGLFECFSSILNWVNERAERGQWVDRKEEKRLLSRSFCFLFFLFCLFSVIFFRFSFYLAFTRKGVCGCVCVCVCVLAEGGAGHIVDVRLSRIAFIYQWESITGMSFD